MPTSATVRIVRTAVVTLVVRRWNVLGVSLGPSGTVDVRLTIEPGGKCRTERIDGKPLGDLAETCRDQIEEAELRLLRVYRESRTTTSRLNRPSSAEAAPASRDSITAIQAMRKRRQEITSALAQQSEPEKPPSGELAPTDCAVPPETVSEKTTSSVFRCDRQGITDRINRLRQKPAEAMPPAPDEGDFPEPPQVPLSAARNLHEAQQKALADMVALREREWRERQRNAQAQAQAQAQDGEFVPTDAAPADPSPAPSIQQKTSSVFRCDQKVVTDRIGKLRKRQPGESPPEVPADPEPPSGPRASA